MGAVESKTEAATLETPAGKLRGLVFCDDQGRRICYRYARIPYALPPTGERRWRRPQRLPEDFSFDKGQDDYTKLGPVCPQPDHIFNFNRAMAGTNECATSPQPHDEDCLYLNIWTPASPVPDEGWPVQIHLHGGWLQQGDASQAPYHDPTHLFATYADHPPRIVVAPTYRLGVFGFLAGEPLVQTASSTLTSTSSGHVMCNVEDSLSNYGLWDQRVAIEWVSKYIGYFGGNAREISVGGQSSGAYSAFFQLYYDAHLPADRRLIKRCYLWSNVPSVQPNPIASAVSTSQFNTLCSLFDVEESLSPQEKLSRLRAVPASALMSRVHELSNFTFRAVTEDSFIPSDLFSSVRSGTFTTRLAQNGTQLFLCEMAREDAFYGRVGAKPPTSQQDLVKALSSYYPPAAVDELVRIYLPRAGRADDACAERRDGAWGQLFGTIVSMASVHAPLRGLTHCLLYPPEHQTALPRGNLVLCHIGWRAQCLDRYVRPDWGSCHVLDAPIWWASGVRAEGWTEQDHLKSHEIAGLFANFVAHHGETTCNAVEHHEKGPEHGVFDVLIDPSGTIKYSAKDDMWEQGLEVWNALQRDFVRQP